MNFNHLYRHLAAAAVRGYAMRVNAPNLPAALLQTPLAALSERELDELLRFGEGQGIKLYRFKRGHDELPRVRQVLGFLKGIAPQSLLDVGSGRGVFLFPFLDTFPQTPVTAVDLLDYRVALLEDIHRGGVSRLTPMRADICAIPPGEVAADVVTLLEVLEHIPDVQAAVSAAVRMAKRYIVVTVPSKPDDNPEHIHLLTKSALTELFRHAGCDQLHFSGVNGHLILVATLSKGA